MSPIISDRFLAKVVVSPNGCHLWQAYINRGGYGQFRVGTRTVLAHRFAYELSVGLIPEGLQIDHLCRVRDCVNPAHLEPVTNRENALRGIGPTALNAVKTSCSAGHLYDEANTYTTTGGWRQCRTCNAARERAYYAARKAQAV